MSVKIRTLLVNGMIFVFFLGVSVTGFALVGNHPNTIRTTHLRDVHSWLGIITVTLAIVHGIVHRRWWTSTFRRFEQLKQAVRSNFVIDSTMGVLFMLAATSGLLLWKDESSHFLLVMHTIISVLIVLIVLTHIFRHWKWVTTTIRWMFPGKVTANASSRLAHKSNHRS